MHKTVPVEEDTTDLQQISTPLAIDPKTLPDATRVKEGPSKPQKTRWSHVLHKTVPLEEDTTQQVSTVVAIDPEPLPVVTSPTNVPTNTRTTTSTMSPLCVVTASHSIIGTPLNVVTLPTILAAVGPIPSISTHSITGLPLSMVTQPTAMSAEGPTPLTSTHSNTGSPLNMVTQPTTTSTEGYIPSTSTVDIGSTIPTATGHHTIVPSTMPLTSVRQSSSTTPTVVSSETSAVKTISEVTASSTDNTASPSSDEKGKDPNVVIDLPTSYRYYDVLTPEEDDIISISHHELMERKCNVTLDHLNPEDIVNIQQSLKPRLSGHS